MKQIAKIVVLIYLALVLDVGLAHDLVIWGCQPSFMAIALVLLAISTRNNGGIVAAATVGFMGDAVRGDALGLGMLLAVLITWIGNINFDVKQKTTSSILRKMMVLTGYVFALNCVLMVLDGKMSWWQTVLTQSVGTVVYSNLILLMLIGLQKIGTMIWSGSSRNVAWR